MMVEMVWVVTGDNDAVCGVWDTEAGAVKFIEGQDEPYNFSYQRCELQKEKT